MGDAAAGAVAVPEWSDNAAERKRQAGQWMSALKRKHRVGTKGETVEQQQARTARLLNEELGTGWTVQRPLTAAGAKFSFSNPNLRNNRRIYGLPNAALAFADAAVAAATVVPAPGPGPALEPAPEDSIRQLEQVEQLLSDGGPLMDFAQRSLEVLRPDRAAAPAGGADQEPDTEEEVPRASLEEEIANARRSASEQLCTAVLFGGTGVGKSTAENVMLMLTEVDAMTYSSPTFRPDPPVTIAGANDELRTYPREALQVIKKKLEEDGVPPEDMDKEVWDRVDVARMPVPTEQEAEAARQRFERDAYVRVSNYPALNNVDANPSSVYFVHPVGALCGATTSLSTTDMYGTTYHMFGLTYSLEKLLAQLLEGLKLERAVLRGEIPEEDEALTTRRKFNYCRWNACVVDAQRLGEGAYVDVGDEYEAFAARCVELPQAFTQEQEPTEADIRRILRPEIVTLAGRFHVHTGLGNNLHADRDYVRTVLSRLASGEDRRAFVYELFYLFCPSQVLKGGKCIVDAPGTADPTPLRQGHLQAASARADHVIAVAPKNLGQGSDTLDKLLDYGVLSRWVNREAKLSVLLNLEKGNNVRGVASFVNGTAPCVAREEAEREAVRLTRSDLMGALLKVPEVAATLHRLPSVAAKQEMRAQLRARVAAEVKVLAIYPLTFAGLMINPLAAQDQLQQLVAGANGADGADPQLESILRNTHGAALLGLLDGLNLERVYEEVKRLTEGPLCDARNAVHARVRAPGAHPTANQELHKAMLSQQRARRNIHGAAAKALRNTMRNEFEPGEDAPLGLLDAGVDAAINAFTEAVNERFDAAEETAHALWEVMRNRFLPSGGVNGAVQRARDALSAPRTGEAAPRGMNLESLLGPFTLPPQSAFDALARTLEEACDNCCDLCADLVDAHVERAFPEAQQERGSQLLADFRLHNGIALLRSKTTRLSQATCIKLRSLQMQLNLFKRRVLRETICDAAPVPSPADPAGVAMLVDARLPIMFQRLRGFTQSVRDAVQRAKEEAQRALQPAVVRPRKGQPTGMEAYLNSAISYVAEQCGPEAAADAAAVQLGALAARGDAAFARASQVVANVRAACANPEALERAAACHLRMQVLQRQLHNLQAGAGPNFFRNRRDDRYLRLSSPPASLARTADQWRSVGNPAGMEALESALLALPATHTGPLAPRDDVAEDNSALLPVNSLWRALAHQMFMPPHAAPNALELSRAAGWIKAVVLRYLLGHYSVHPGAAARWAERERVTIQDYVEQHHRDERGAGLREVQAAAYLFNCQVAVWVAGRDPVEPLLASNQEPLTENAYNIVLARTERRNSPLGALHTFLSTGRPRNSLVAPISVGTHFMSPPPHGGQAQPRQTPGTVQGRQQPERDDGQGNSKRARAESTVRRGL